MVPLFHSKNAHDAETMRHSAAGFNPSSAGVPNGNYFALPFSVEESPLALLSAPWDATVSYRAGTAAAPSAIIAASSQVDLFDIEYGNIWQHKIGTIPIDHEIIKHGKAARSAACKVIAALEKGMPEDSPFIIKNTSKVNAASHWFNARIRAAAAAMLAQGKIVGLVGGDHSAPYGLLMALCERHAEFGILHIDAHADLRERYEGFEFSHASIMYNALRCMPQVQRIVQVALRDMCQEESAMAENDMRLTQFNAYRIAEQLYSGISWHQICENIVAALPREVYISFDIDGLSPDNCPSTGTPVPGGLSFMQAAYLLRRVGAGRRIIGFDLCEVCPRHDDEWDAIAGARMLYKLCGSALCTANSD